MSNRYQSKVHFVEAMKLTKENLDEAAVWCGGKVIESSKNSDPTDVYRALQFPTLNGIVNATIGDVLTKDADGRFNKMTTQDFENMFESKPVTSPFTDGRPEGARGFESLLDMHRTRGMTLPSSTEVNQWNTHSPRNMWNGGRE